MSTDYEPYLTIRTLLDEAYTLLGELWKDTAAGKICDIATIDRLEKLLFKVIYNTPRDYTNQFSKIKIEDGVPKEIWHSMAETLEAFAKENHVLPSLKMWPDGEWVNYRIELNNNSTISTVKRSGTDTNTLLTIFQIQLESLLNE